MASDFCRLYRSVGVVGDSKFPFGSRCELVGSHAQCVVLFRILRPGSQCRGRECTHCGTLHPGDNTVAIALYAGHPPTLSQLPDLGAVSNPAGTGSSALFPATARDPWRTRLLGNWGLAFCLVSS